MGKVALKEKHNTTTFTKFNLLVFYKFKIYKTQLNIQTTHPTQFTPPVSILNEHNKQSYGLVLGWDFKMCMYIYIYIYVLS